MSEVAALAAAATLRGKSGEAPHPISPRTPTPTESDDGEETLMGALSQEMSQDIGTSQCLSVAGLAEHRAKLLESVQAEESIAARRNEDLQHKIAARREHMRVRREAAQQAFDAQRASQEAEMVMLRSELQKAEMEAMGAKSRIAEKASKDQA